MVTPIIYQQVTSSSVGGVQGGVATLATSWQGLVGLVWSVVFLSRFCHGGVSLSPHFDSVSTFLCFYFFAQV